MAIQELTSYEVGAWALGLVVLVWNRIDSRSKAYRFRFKAPGGSEASVDVGHDRE
jgi:hypothetical protein